MLNVAMFGGSRNQRGFFMCLTPVIRNYCFFGFSPIASLHPAMLRGTARERLMPGLLLSLFFQPLRPSDTSPIFPYGNTGEKVELLLCFIAFR